MLPPVERTGVERRSPGAGLWLVTGIVALSAAIVWGTPARAAKGKKDPGKDDTATAVPAPAPAPEESVIKPLPGPNTNRIYVGVYLHDVANLDLKSGVFEADVEMWAKWRGEFDVTQLQIANAATVERVSLGGKVDGDWHSERWRIRGTLRGEFPLQAFPFDEQRLSVVVELPELHGRLVPDLASSGMADSFSITDWEYEPNFRPRVFKEDFSSDLGNLALEGDSTTVHRVAFQVVMIRPIVTVALKLFLPLCIIALVGIASLFLHPGDIPARASMSVTALLSCFAFQFTIADTLPAVGYLTLADTLFLVAYVVSTVAIWRYHRRSRVPQGRAGPGRHLGRPLPCGCWSRRRPLRRSTS